MIWEYDTQIDGQPSPELLITENETNTERLYNLEHYTQFFKDAFHQYIIHGMLIYVRYFCTCLVFTYWFGFTCSHFNEFGFLATALNDWYTTFACF